MSTPSTRSAVSTRPPFQHRGFALALIAARAGGRFGFVILHEGCHLHASGLAYGTPVAAERAARLFVDDALAAYEAATTASASL